MCASTERLEKSLCTGLLRSAWGYYQPTAIHSDIARYERLVTIAVYLGTQICILCPGNMSARLFGFGSTRQAYSRLRLKDRLLLSTECCLAGIWYLQILSTLEESHQRQALRTERFPGRKLVQR
ncbi:hypothetical protein ALPO108162_03505 [Alicyclobacillus pomorum]